jgi:hypothetical protein
VLFEAAGESWQEASKSAIQQEVTLTCPPNHAAREDRATIAEQIEINYKGFDNVTFGKTLNSVQKQIDQPNPRRLTKNPANLIESLLNEKTHREPPALK